MTHYSVNNVKWKYVVDRSLRSRWSNQDANAYGEKGWEMISAVPYTDVDGYGDAFEMIMVVYKYPYIEVDEETQDPDDTAQ